MPNIRNLEMMSTFSKLLLILIAVVLAKGEARVGGESEKEQDRELGYYGAANHYYYGGGARRYYGGGRHYYGGGRRYYRYYKKRYYNHNSDNADQGDDTSATDVDENVNEATDNTEDNSAGDYDETTWRGKISALETKAEESVHKLYDSTQCESSSNEWFLFTVFLILLIFQFPDKKL